MAKLRTSGAIAKPLHAAKLSARIPDVANAPLRISEGDAWLEVSPNETREVRATHVDGGIVYANAGADFDLVYVKDEARVEELRLAKTRAAAAYASWNLRKGPGSSSRSVSCDGARSAAHEPEDVRDAS